MVIANPHDTIEALEDTLAGLRRANERLSQALREAEAELRDYKDAERCGMTVAQLKKWDKRFYTTLHGMHEEAKTGN